MYIKISYIKFLLAYISLYSIIIFIIIFRQCHGNYRSSVAYRDNYPYDYYYLYDCVAYALKYTHVLIVLSSIQYIYIYIYIYIHLIVYISLYSMIT